MSITNGYATLAEMKARWFDARTYTTNTLTFTSATNTISDSAWGLKRFRTGNLLKVSGAAYANGLYTIAVGDVAASLVTSGSFVGEAAGSNVTLTDVTDQIDDAVFESMVEGISRAIDHECGRRFYTSGSDEARYYSPDTYWNMLAVPDDIISVTKIETDDALDRTYSTLWASTDWELWPWNAALDGRPYTEIHTTPLGQYRFLVGQARSVKVTGRFGFSATAPTPIKEACLLAAEKLFRRKDAIFGVVGSATFGTLKQMMKDDPELNLLLAGYRKLV